MTEPSPEAAVQGCGAGVSLHEVSAAPPAERLIEVMLGACALFSVVLSAAIVGILAFESSTFFAQVGLVDFLTDAQWTPLFADAHFGVLPLLCGTLLSSLLALALALPLGLVCAVWLSEFASVRTREIVKPCLELIAAIPTVVFGYFALVCVTPFLQSFMPWLSGFNLLSASLVMGIMIVPYVSSLSEDAMRAVPRSLRDASLALGANGFQTAWGVVVPAAFSGLSAAFILAFARAVGETMVVAIAGGLQPNLTLDPTQPAATITAFIVQVSLGDLPHGSIGYRSIFALGLVLFLVTLSFNLLGNLVRRRFRENYTA